MSDRQELLDKFYFAHGPSCAGCDWWRSLNSRVGECLKSAPVGVPAPPPTKERT